jgi:hypothetical protein
MRTQQTILKLQQWNTLLQRVTLLVKRRTPPGTKRRTLFKSFNSEETSLSAGTSLLETENSFTPVINLITHVFIINLEVLSVPAGPRVKTAFWEIAWSPWRWRQYAPLNCPSTSTRLHRATSQKAVIFITAAVRTWNFTDPRVFQRSCQILIWRPNQ